MIQHSFYAGGIVSSLMGLVSRLAMPKLNTLKRWHSLPLVVLTFLFLGGFPLAGWAQTRDSQNENVIVVGGNDEQGPDRATLAIKTYGSSSSSVTLGLEESPFGRYYGYEYKVYLYRPNCFDSEFNGTISKIAFKADAASSSGGNMKIWLKDEASDYTLSSSSTFSSFTSGATQVYNGSCPSTSSGSWSTLTCTGDFYHDYQKSLLVIMRVQAASSSGDGGVASYYVSYANVEVMWHLEQDGSDPGTSTSGSVGGMMDTRALPAVQFTYTYQTSPPSSVTAPTVTTNSSASSITSSGATCGGNLTSTGGASTTRGICYMVGTSGNPTTSNSTKSAGSTSSTGTFSVNLTGLSAGTTYRYRAYATNSAGTSYGSTYSFTTSSAGPANATCSSATSISCGGSLSGTTVGTSGTAHGTGYTASNYGVWYKFTGDGQSTTVSLTNVQSGFDPALIIVSGSCGSFTQVYRADSGGGGGGETYTFTTANGTNYFIYVAYYGNSGGSSDVGTFTISRTCTPVAPTVTTTDGATSISATGATVGGNLTSTGGASTTRGICYGTGSTPTTSNSTSSAGSTTSTGTFSRALSSLASNTKYYYRAYAYNSANTSSNPAYGSIYNFTTLPTGVNTTAITVFDDASATMGGSYTTGGNADTERGVVYCLYSQSTSPAIGNTGCTKVTMTASSGTFSKSVTGLAAATKYAVRAYVTNAGGTVYGSTQSFTTAAGPPATVPYEYTFETSDTHDNSSSWIVEGSTTNYWCIGTGAYYAGSRGLYVTNNGSSYTYSNGTAATSYAYRLIHLEAGSTYKFSYYYKCMGEGSSTRYDYMRVLLAPADVNVTSASFGNTTTSTPSGWTTALDGSACLNQNSSWTYKSAEYTVSSTGDYKMVFVWRNDGSQGSDPGAVDNVKVEKKYTVTASSVSNGTLSVSPTTAYAGETITITAAPNSGYVISGGKPTTSPSCTVSGSGTSYTFTMPSSNVTVSATYITTPTVTTSAVSDIATTTATGNGNVTATGGASVTERGVCWSTSANPTISNSHNNNGTGTGSYSVSMTGLTAGTTYHVRAYATNSVGTAYGSDVTFTTKANATLTYGVSPSGSGSVSVLNGSTPVSSPSNVVEGTSLNISATANTGYTFSSWSATSGTIANAGSASTTFTMGSAATTLTANFTQNDYSITYVPSSSSPSNGCYVSGVATAHYNDEVTVSVTTAANYELTALTYTPYGESAVDILSSKKFNMPAKAVTVNATFALSGYTLTYTASSTGGTISVETTGGVNVTSGTTVASGTTLNITATPSSGYFFSGWSVSGTGSSVAASSSASTTFTMGTAATTLSATFKQAPHTISDNWEDFAEAVSCGYTYSGETVTLANNLSLSSYSGGPVGTSTNSFQGTFNGNGHTISGYSSSGATDNGLFGHVSGSAQIHDLVVSATISGSSTNAGIVVGTLAAGTMYNVAAVGTLSSSGTNKGGLVGSNSGNIYNCYSNVSYSGSATNMGGLVGTNSGNVKNCYAAGVSGSVKAQAGSNSGTIEYCYANDGEVLGTYSGTFTAPQSDIKNINYMYRDNVVTATGNTYLATGYTNGHAPKWNGLVSVLNQWAEDGDNAVSGVTYAKWYRPLTTNINGDLPIMGFSGHTSVGTNGDAKLLNYGGLDALLSPVSATSIFLYGNEASVTNVPGSGVYVYVNEDAVLKQSGSSDFERTTVGITFDNSCGTAQDYYGNTLLYDWHFMSTPLRNAAIGATYSTGTYSASSGANISNMVNGYFPNGLTMLNGDVKWDLYTYYEPDYHWINFKRSKNNHWHSDGRTNIEYGEADQSTDAASGNFIPGKGYMMAISQNTYMNQTGTLNRGNVNITLTRKEPLAVNYQPGANLVGNPYQAYLDLDEVMDENSDISSIYVYDADNKNYIAYTSGASDNPAVPSRYIHPHQGFFVIAPSGDYPFKFTPDMAVTTTWTYSHYRDDDKVNYPLVNLYVKNEAGQSDLAVVEFHRPELGGAEKLEAMRNAPFTLSAHHDRDDYAILFATDDINRVPVHFKTAEDGQMTLTWETYNGQFNSLHLVDNITGVNYDMLTHDSYTFNASTEHYSARFYITYDCSGTGIEENDDNDGASTGSATATFAYIHNGNIVIDGVETSHGASLQVIDVMGRVMYSTVCTDGVHTVSTNGFAKGVYLLRLSDSKQVRVQKIVVQ